MNEAIFYFLNSFAGRSLWLDSFIAFVAVDFVFVFLALIFIDAVTRRNSWREKRAHLAMVMTALVFSSIGWFLSVASKLIYTHPRPFEALPNVRQLISESGNSFPSGHTTFLFTVAFVLFAFDRKLAWFGVIVGTLVGFARVMAGVHWPFDIVGGVILAGVIAVVSSHLLRKISQYLS